MHAARDLPLGLIMTPTVPLRPLVTAVVRVRRPRAAVRPAFDQGQPSTAGGRESSSAIALTVRRSWLLPQARF